MANVDVELLKNNLRAMAIQITKLEKKIDDMDNDHGNHFKTMMYEIDAIKIDFNVAAQCLGLEERV